MLQDFYPDFCTIQQQVEVQDEIGHPVPTWSSLQPYVNIPCRLSPNRGAGEIKGLNQIYTKATHVIELTQPAEGITSKMRAVIGGVNYDILLPERDGQGKSSRLVVERVT